MEIGDKNYLLTIRLPFQSMDDPAARSRANDIRENRYIINQRISEVNNVKIKLQRLEEGDEPIGIKIGV